MKKKNKKFGKKLQERYEKSGKEKPKKNEFEGEIPDMSEELNPKFD